MNGFPSRGLVDSLRKQYPQGTRVELVSMSDPYTTLQPGDKGTVSLVDSMGTIFVDWDNGSGLGVAYGEDRVRRLEPERSRQPGQDHLRGAEIDAEQNYNMVGDALINNVKTPKADLTDGQTHEEIRELAPETLPAEIQSGSERPSLLGQVEQYKSDSGPMHPEETVPDPELEL